MKATPQTFLRFIAGAAVAAAVLFLVWYFSSIVVYILVSAVLAVMGNPLVKFLAGLHFKGWQVPRWLAALATLDGDLGRPGYAVFAVRAAGLQQDQPVRARRLRGGRGEHRRADRPDAAAILQALFALPESTFSLSDDTDRPPSSRSSTSNSLNTIFSSIINLVLSSVIAIFSISFITFFFLKDGGPVLCDGHRRVPGTLSRQHHPCAGFRDGPAGALLYGYPLGKPAADDRRVADDDGLRDEGRRRGVHRPYHGCDERRALRRAADRRRGLGLRGHRYADRGHERGAYGFRDRRVAADPQGAWTISSCSRRSIPNE